MTHVGRWIVAVNFIAALVVTGLMAAIVRELRRLTPGGAA